ncbi:ROK family protein [Amycolatopsis acidicola]|uniref:ROK family protein n=1 Tax=Amycolatopsis acidicola TaxID=2596893 RepID=A0A5N0UJJ7_9PSEU|nr:ROK family protein [Amycolatopsis acidicola]KAA9149410.1 ROK family protein [Amycolatopsis acidicola]
MSPEGNAMSRNGSRPAGVSTVLREVLASGPVARSTVARRTGLSAAAVSGHVAELTAFGLVRALPGVTGGPQRAGRPHVPLDIDTAQHVVGAIHLAVPHATIALLDLRANVLQSARVPHEGRGPHEVLARAADRMLAMMTEHAFERSAIGVGVATGGWVDQDAGTIVEHPVLGWRDVPVRDLLAARTGLPIEADAHSRALIHAERLFGQASGTASVLQLFVGNVVDAAFATADTVQHGPRSAAGAIAHLPVDDSDEPCSCGRRGCLQASVSERALAARAVAGGLLTKPSFMDLLALGEQGSPAAVELFRERARLLGRAVAPVLDLLNPDVVTVVEPGVSRIPGCLAELRDAAAARVSMCRDPRQTLHATSFPATALATAAGAAVLTEFYRNPLSWLRKPRSWNRISSPVRKIDQATESA